MKIDLSKLPDGTKWIAIDPDGECYAFEDEPSLGIEDGKYVYFAEGGGAWDYQRIGNVHD